MQTRIPMRATLLATLALLAACNKTEAESTSNSSQVVDKSVADVRSARQFAAQDTPMSKSVAEIDRKDR